MQTIDKALNVSIVALKQEKIVAKFDGAGKLEGFNVKIEPEMVASIFFNKVVGHAVIKLKEDKVCDVFSNNRLVGGLVCGADVPVKGNLQEVRQKLGLPKISLDF